MTSAQLRDLGMVWVVALVTACANDDPHTIRADFRQSPQGWTAGFADYPVGEDDFYELVSDYRPLEAPLNTDESALIISGNNHSDDLWMYYKGRLIPAGILRLWTGLLRFAASIHMLHPGFQQ